jgi:hypothetical protein
MDTNQLDAAVLAELRALVPVPCEFVCVSVSERERGDRDSALGVVPETAVWGESLWGSAVSGGPIPGVCDHGGVTSRLGGPRERAPHRRVRGSPFDHLERQFSKAG